MKIAIIICRILLGLGFVVFGLNILHPFMPMEAPPAGSLTAQFMGVMMPTHWMTIVGLFQFFGGLLVLIGGTAPMGLLLLAPVLVNILLFHICVMGGQGIVPGLVFSILEAFLVYAYWPHFSAIFVRNAKPRG